MAQVVEGIIRQPLSYGLFSVLTPRPDDDPHWQNGEGIVWETIGCEPASGIGPYSCDEVTGLPKNLDSGAGELGEATPFTVYASYTCTPTGHTVEYAQQRAEEKLLAREEARVEQAFWTGDLDNGGFAPDAVSAGTGLALDRAIARLEQWIAENFGSTGVIHMTREAATMGIAEDVLKVRDGILTTVLGTPVVAGAGYPGTGPADEDPGDSATYIYATPAVLGYRSDVFPGAEPVSAGFDRARNDLHAVAERNYIVGYEPCGTAYVLATLTGAGE